MGVYLWMGESEIIILLLGHKTDRVVLSAVGMEKECLKKNKNKKKHTLASCFRSNFEHTLIKTCESKEPLLQKLQEEGSLSF